MTEWLAQMMFVQMVRAYLATAPVDARWLRALGDEVIDAAIRSIHGEPARRWTVAGLAGAAGMSRSTFAARFKDVVGLAPLEYTLRWRMWLARRALATSEATMAAIASGIGYDSESSFSAAFKRTSGFAPSHFREAHRRDRA